MFQRTKLEEPNESYDLTFPAWERARAVVQGQRFVKEHDMILGLSNMLIPFSTSMSQEQYTLYQAESELPGITAQFSRMLVGGLLRKKPQIEFSDKVPQEAIPWITDSIAADGGSMVALLDELLFEEVQTSRCWVYIEYPSVEATKAANMTPQEWAAIRPFPVTVRAENIINWTSEVIDDNMKLSMLLVRGYEYEYVQEPTNDPVKVGQSMHPIQVDTIWLHEIVDGKYQIRKFANKASMTADTKPAGSNPSPNKHTMFSYVDTATPMSYGKRLTDIPAWPLNGSIEIVEPLLTPLIDKEIALYNKMSRRNHLLYGAATYTPIVYSDMLEKEFLKIVESGLGTWLLFKQGDKAEVLETPTDALADSDRAIAAGIEEMAKLGIRMLAPESAQSGIALELRNANQTAQIGTLSVKASTTMSDVIAYMINRRYGLALTRVDVNFKLTADFDPTPLGADWLRLATEWYQNGMLPRSSWLALLRANDMIEPGYNDVKGVQEINADEIILPSGGQQNTGLHNMYNASGKAVDFSPD